MMKCCANSLAYTDIRPSHGKRLQNSSGAFAFLITQYNLREKVRYLNSLFVMPRIYRTMLVSLESFQFLGISFFSAYDPQGSLTVSLGVKNLDELDTTISDLMQVVVDNGNLSPRDNGILKDIEGVDLVPSNIGLSSLEVSLANTMSREFVLRSYLGAVKQDYDYVLIDCMPSLGMLTINALAAADSVLIPCQANYLSTKGLKLLMGSVAKVRRQINPELRIDGILLTMVDS